MSVAIEERASAAAPRRIAATQGDAVIAGIPLPLQRADGLELLAEYKGCGFKEPQFLARRADGQVLQLSGLLYSVARHADGRRDAAAIADAVSADVARRVTADNVHFLAERKLRPLGVLAAADGSSPRLERADPLLALKFRTKVVPAGVVRRLTTVFCPLFLAPIVLAALVAFFAGDGWLLAAHGIAPSLRHVLYEPLLLVALFGCVALATAFHEVGHAAACRYGGARPGVMGIGLYLVWPAFYTDVTDAYRLGRGGRLRTDLGGIYFNALVAVLTLAVYAVTGFEPLLLLVLVQTFAILQQLLPLLRLDGYYILSDLAGVPDMLSRIGPVLRSLRPGAPSDPRVTCLKPWVRVVVTAYVLVVVPLLAVALALMVVNAPRVLSTAWDSLGLQWHRLSGALGSGAIPAASVSGLQLVALALPTLGMIVTVGRVGARGAGAARRWSAGQARRRALLAGATAAAAAGLIALWWPNGEYRPIQPQERWTVSEAVASLRHIGSGRPSLPAADAAPLGGAPTWNEDAAPAGGSSGPDAVPRGAPGRSGSLLTTAAPGETPGDPSGGDTGPTRRLVPVGALPGVPVSPGAPWPTPVPQEPGATPAPAAPAPEPTATPTPESSPAPVASPTPTPTPTSAPTPTPTPTIEAAPTP